MTETDSISPCSEDGLIRAKRRRNASSPSAVRIQLLEAINQHISSYSPLPEMVEQIVRTTQMALRAEASSVLLVDEAGDRLYFQVAEGAKADELKEVTVDLHSGIAGWVASHREAAVVNDVTKDHRFTGEVDRSVGFVTRSLMCVPLMVHTSLIGVLEVLNRLDETDFTERDLDTLKAVAATAAIAIENTRLQHSLEQGYKATMRSLAAAIDAKDPYTRGHSQRVMEYAVMAGLSYGLSQGELGTLEQAAILHDVGKIGVDDAILRKPGSLTAEERLKVQDHPVIGAAIIDGIPFLKDARELIMHHHERLDGSGYPHQLIGDEIPVGARLLAVADAFDTMTTDRPYRKALSLGEAMKEFESCSGSQFCPRAVEAFLNGLHTHGSAGDPVVVDVFGHSPRSRGDVRHAKKAASRKSDR
jgi:hypothetical protein